MRFGILSGIPGWHVDDLQRAIEALGHTSVLFDFRTLSGSIGTSRNFFQGVDFLIVRTMPHGSLEQVIFRMDLLLAAEASGCRVINSPRSLELCIDKYLTLSRLEQHGIMGPKTFVCQTADQAAGFFEELGGDVVVKPLFGSEGRGMVRVSDLESAWRVFTSIERIQAVLYLQKYIHHPGWDLRTFVLNHRVLGSMKRYAVEGWRTNVAQGAKAESCEISEELRALSLQVSEILGTDIVGIDFIRDETGKWMVLEANGVPGWKALSTVCRVDVARELILSLQK
jgi:RimK family alpha-L-glutamate ligase